MMNINVTRRFAVNLIVPAVIAVGIAFASAERADAGALRGSWNAPSNVNYGSYSTYYRYRSYYSPIFFGFTARYAPACNPCCVPACSPCSPCGVGSPCQVSSASKTGEKLTPEKETNGLPKTFRNEEGDPPKPMGDSKFNKRDESKKFEPTRKKEAEKFPAGKQKAFKNPDNEKKVPESLIKKKKPAPAKSAKGDEEEKTKTPPQKKTETQGGPRILRLNLDEKITWRALPKRTRLVIRNSVSVPTIARAKAEANRNWTPVARGTKIAGK